MKWASERTRILSLDVTLTTLATLPSSDLDLELDLGPGKRQHKPASQISKSKLTAVNTQHAETHTPERLLHPDHYSVCEDSDCRVLDLACKNLSDEMLARLSVWSDVHMICKWSS